MKKADIICDKTEAISIAREYGDKGLALFAASPCDDITKVSLAFWKPSYKVASGEENAILADDMLELIGKHGS